MEAEYRQFLIPKEHVYRPSAEQLMELIQELQKEGWLPAADADPPPALVRVVAEERSEAYNPLPWPLNLIPGTDIHETAYTPKNQPVALPSSAAELGQWMEQDLCLIWRYLEPEKSGLRYPLDPRELPLEEAHYDFRIHVSHEYVYTCSELIEAQPHVWCVCGYDLEHEPQDDIFFATRLARACDSCGTVFDPADVAITVRDGWTYEPKQVPGGAIYRFAILIDCGTAIPANQMVGVHEDLQALCSKVTGCDFYDLGEVY